MAGSADRKALTTEQIANSLVPLSVTLPSYVDRTRQLYGRDVYERMMRDPGVRAPVWQLATQVFAPELELLPAVGAPQSDDAAEVARHEQAVEIAEFARRALGAARQPVARSLRVAFRAIWQGYTALEITLAQGAGQDAGRLVLSSLRDVTERVELLVDRFERVVGYRTRLGGVTVEPWKIWHLAFGDTDDPRGQSVLEPAYNWWWGKQSDHAEWQKANRRVGSLSLAAVLPEEMPMEAEDPETGERISVEDAVLASLQNVQNGSVMTAPYGTSIQELGGKGDGKAFSESIAEADRQIARAVLTTARTVMEATRSSQADAGEASDVVQQIVGDLRGWLLDSFRRSVLELLTIVNFGPDARDLTPIPTLNAAPRADWANDMRAASQAGWQPAPEHMPEMDARLGLTPRDMDAELQRRADEASASERRAEEMGRFLDPAPDDE